MGRHKKIAHLSEVPLEQMKTPEGSAFGGFRQRVGMALGARKLGYSFFTVPPGKAAFPFHLHHANEEMIYILDGEAVLRRGKQEITVSSGTFVACLPGPENPHQLVNTSSGDLRYLVVSTMEYPDISEYPDSQKIGAYATSAAEGGFRALYRKDSNLSYFDGESGSEVERIMKSKA
ncbi:MAG: cupin domain-containing protein [Deltaproteobacteria bacterium]|nr:cupin domain-containing protein [Deltaproteobacteria bacterium]